MDKPKTAVMLFSNGQAMCTGGKSLEEAEEAIRMTCEKIEGAGGKVFKKPAVTVQTMVASVDIHRSLDLKALVHALWLENVAYDPDQFPGVIYRMSDPKVCLLLFESGKIVCTGAHAEDIATALDTLMNKLSSVGM
jgi:transcription initiation factor TFIID TATA-box-binding protein